MTERLIKQRELELTDWRYEEIALIDLRHKIDNLIETHGEQAYIYISADTGLEINVNWTEPETDQELQKRLTEEAVQANWKELVESAREKLTPEERLAVNRYRFSHVF